jgi:CRP-like cAMP-binding protein
MTDTLASAILSHLQDECASIDLQIAKEQNEFQHARDEVAQAQERMERTCNSLMQLQIRQREHISSAMKRISDLAPESPQRNSVSPLPSLKDAKSSASLGSSNTAFTTVDKIKIKGPQLPELESLEPFEQKVLGSHAPNIAKNKVAPVDLRPPKSASPVLQGRRGGRRASQTLLVNPEALLTDVKGRYWFKFKKFGLIMPESPFRVGWDMFMLLLIVYYAVSVPLTVGFNLNPINEWMELVFNLFFIVDIVLNFRTPFLRKGQPVLNKKEIAIHYFQTWFFVDFIASLPFDIYQMFTRKNGKESSAFVFRLNKMIRLIRIFKLLRLLKLSRILHRMLQYTRLNPSVFLLLKMLSVTFFTWHWCACLYWLVASTEFQDSEPIRFPDGFLPPINIEEGTMSSKYSWAFYYSISLTTGVGVDVVANNPMEVFFSTSMIVLGIILHVTIIGSVTSVVSTLSSSKKKRLQSMERTFDSLRSQQVSQTLQDKIRGYYEYMWEHGVDVEQKVHTSIENLPRSLQVALSNEINENLRERVPIFKSLSAETSFDIFKALVRMVYLPGDRLITEGQAGDEMFIIIKGVVKVVMRNIQIAVLTEGDFMGENAMLNNSPRNATCIAMEYCDILTLRRKDFQEAVKQHPEVRETMMQLIDQELRIRKFMLVWRKFVLVLVAVYRWTTFTENKTLSKDRHASQRSAARMTIINTPMRRARLTIMQAVGAGPDTGTGTAANNYSRQHLRMTTGSGSGSGGSGSGGGGSS